MSQDTFPAVSWDPLTHLQAVLILKESVRISGSGHQDPVVKEEDLPRLILCIASEGVRHGVFLSGSAGEDQGALGEREEGSNW